MKKIFSILLWASSIGLLSFAYDDFLSNELYLKEEHGLITSKGVETYVSNLYGNYQADKLYWIEILDEKIMVTKGVFQSVHVRDEVKISRTKHGVFVEKI
jgi:hypothetical protein